MIDPYPRPAKINYHKKGRIYDLWKERKVSNKCLHEVSVVH